MMETNKTNTKNRKNAEMIMRHFVSERNDFTVTSVEFGQPNINVGVGLYDIYINANTYLTDFQKVYLLFKPTISHIPNPSIIKEWLVNHKVKIVSSDFISPRVYRHNCIYQDVEMVFDVEIA